MKHFNPQPEPRDFDRRARQPGRAWLRDHLDQAGNLPQGTRPRDYWSDFRGALAEGFDNLCAYTVMLTTEGTVDHYLSCNHHPDLAYEWSNYRFVMGWINSSKGDLDAAVLDPFEVQEDWFEIILPSLQLCLTDKVPPAQRDRAQFTLTRLHLDHDERIIRVRQQWYQLYLDGYLPLAGLQKVAPLIACAVMRDIAERSEP